MMVACTANMDHYRTVMYGPVFVQQVRERETREDLNRETRVDTLCRDSA